VQLLLLGWSAPPGLVRAWKEAVARKSDATMKPQVEDLAACVFCGQRPDVRYDVVYRKKNV